MTHRDRAGDASGQRAGQRVRRREAAGDAGTPARLPDARTDSPARSLWVIINETWYKDSPVHRPVESAKAGEVIALPQVGGLHHRYERLAA